MGKLKNDIGNRVRSLRQRAGLTQQALELAIDTSAGSLSRIESGETNPTKETLGKIADELNLNPTATSYLYGIPITEPSKNQIKKVVSQVRDEIDDHFAPAYVLDYKWNIYHWNRITSKVFQLDDDFLRRMDKRHLILIYFDPVLNVAKSFSKKQYELLGIELLYQFEYECKYFEEEEWYKEIMIKLNTFPAYRAILGKDYNHSGSYSQLMLNKFKMNSPFGLLDFECLLSLHYQDQRFSLVKYFPKNPFTMKLMKATRKVWG